MKKTFPFKSGIKNASGIIEFNMTNDFMFRSVLQESEPALKGLISSMLHIPRDEIGEVKIENPIELGETVQGKTFVLDIKVRLLNMLLINLEMQVINSGNWPNRSLSYLCRNFDNVQKGHDYNSVTPVIHLGFLDFDLFEDDTEFYSHHMMTNVNTNRIFNDKMVLNVLYLNRIDNATEEDKRWNIDKWARMFRSKTWEDLRMIVQYDEDLVAAADKLFLKNSEENLRDLYRLRQDNINHEKRMKENFQKLNIDLSEKDDLIAKKEARISELDAQISELDTQISERDAQISEKDAQISEKDAQISEKDAIIEELKRQLAQKS